jgi:hypothetical protein
MSIIFSAALSLNSASAQTVPGTALYEPSGIFAQPAHSKSALPYSTGYSATSLLAPVEESESKSAIPASLAPDWSGLKKDTAYFLGWQFVVIGALYSSPESVSSWSPEEKNGYGLDKWKNNVSNPVVDGDVWYINFVLHPYWGATYYTRARERGLDRTDSFLTAVAWSALFEYTSEALFEPVSLQDLIVTPVAGALIGEYVFAPLRENINAKPGGPNTLDKALLVVTDPFYYLNNWADRVLGIKTDVQLQLSNVTPRSVTAEPNAPAVSQWNIGLRTTW